jgi:hypothetical protein
MKKTFLYLLVSISIIPIRTQLTVEQFLTLKEKERVAVIKALSVKLAKELPVYFDRYIADAVSAADECRKKSSVDEIGQINSGKNVFYNDPGRDFKYHLFHSILKNSKEIDDQVLGFSSKNSLTETISEINGRTFDEVFCDNFVPKLAQSCETNDPDHLLYYFQSAFFCMRIFNAAL